MKIFLSTNVGSFVFLALTLAILHLLFVPVLRAWIFKMKLAKLVRWSRENPNLFTTEPVPSKLFFSLGSLRRKLKGDWPRFVKKPAGLIFLLSYLEAYPNSKWKISGRALEKILKGEDVSDRFSEEIVLCVKAL